VEKVISGAKVPSVGFGSWGVLVVEDASARFLWFRGPEEMASELITCVGRFPTAQSDGQASPLAETHSRYLKGELHVIVLLNCLIEALKVPPGNGDRSILWWGPFYDLAYSEAKAPSALRSWFRRRTSENGDSVDEDHALKPSESKLFVRFVERISFGIDSLEDDAAPN